MELGISGVIGLLFGSVLAWLALRSRTVLLEAQLSLSEKELAAGKADLARLLEDQRTLLGHGRDWNRRWNWNERPATKRLNCSRQRTSAPRKTCRKRSRRLPLTRSRATTLHSFRLRR